MSVRFWSARGIDGVPDSVLLLAFAGGRGGHILREINHGCFGPGIIAFAIMLLVCGCSERSNVKMVPVAGVVTLDGQPIENVLVSFQPKANSNSKSGIAPGSFDTTDSQGRFVLKSNAGFGAMVGEHVVVLAYRDEPEFLTGRVPRSRAKVKLPVHAYDGSMRFVVPEGGTRQAVFDLTSLAQ